MGGRRHARPPRAALAVAAVVVAVPASVVLANLLAALPARRAAGCGLPGCCAASRAVTSAGVPGTRDVIDATAKKRGNVP